MIGFPLGLGIARSQVRALVQGSGIALKMSAAQFSRQLTLSAALRKELGRYTSALMAQIGQTAGCNRFHGVDVRLVRWLLMTRDRMHSTDIHLTHAFLGHMLGVRREGVTEAAGKLQKAGLIKYNHGHIRILDEKGLETAACACYKSIKETHQRSPQAARL
jgi:CRP-like cAMP-binding protein